MEFTTTHYLPERTCSSLMKIIPSNIVCPRCNSKNLYLFGKDSQGFQKYQCKVCKRQFAPDNITSKIRKHPVCPRCGKASFLHHDHTYYSNYRCCDKNCNHSFNVPKEIKVTLPSSEFSRCSFSMKRMRHPLYIVLAALNYYFMANVTTRKTAQLIAAVHQVNISHVSISKWIKRFAPVFQLISDSLKAQLSLSDSD